MDMIYSIVPTNSKIVKKTDYPEILSLKLVEANMEKDPNLRTVRDAIWERTHVQKKLLPNLDNNMPKIIMILLCARIFCG